MAAALSLMTAAPVVAQPAPKGGLEGPIPIPTYSMGSTSDGAPQSPVLTIDQDRLFTGSAFGKRVATDVEAAQNRLLTENRRIESLLTAEEKDLAEKRAGMAPPDFRKLADAFDARVQKIRHDQGAKNRAISDYREAERKRFFQAALPVLGQLVRDSGAVAILNRQATVLSLGSVDITDRAIARLDARLGDGAKGSAGINFDSITAPTGSGVAAGQPGGDTTAPPPTLPSPSPQPTAPRPGRGN